MKERLDVLLVQKGLAKSRENAKAVIMCGDVFVNNEREDKPGTKIDIDADIIVKGNKLKYVSRGGLKLEKAMDNFDVTIDGNAYYVYIQNKGFAPDAGDPYPYSFA